MKKITKKKKNPDNEKEIEFDVIRSIEIFPLLVWLLARGIMDDRQCCALVFVT